ncbi:MAG: MBL fold metallo-hydrolase [Bacteroidota bacterium]|nr:MBL fold metallo-hydrolase [Bacteroidota bacterium]
MEKLILLGTGNAGVTECYNTCFAILSEDKYFLVDAGGGNGILTQLKHAKISLNALHHVFVSHSHTDHILGVIWVMRMIGAKMAEKNYCGNLNIYCHNDLVDKLISMAKFTLTNNITKLIGERIIIHSLEDGDSREILDYNVQFFDIHSKKLTQFGFSLFLKNGKRFTFIGDEPYNESEYQYANQVDWLLHEAFCLYSERDIFSPYKKHHATVKEACETAEKLNIKNLVLYHTEDKNILQRKELYTKEGTPFYSGSLFVPDDLEVIDL